MSLCPSARINALVFEEFKGYSMSFYVTIISQCVWIYDECLLSVLSPFGIVLHSNMHFMHDIVSKAQWLQQSPLFFPFVFF